jgi:hypothetical protein
MRMIEAATDGRDQLRYIAGADAEEIYETRMKVGDGGISKGDGPAVFWRYHKTRLVPCVFSNERSDCPHSASYRTVFFSAKSENGAINDLLVEAAGVEPSSTI